MMNKVPIIEEIFSNVTYEPDREINGMYHPYIALQYAGEPVRYSITQEQYTAFAHAIVKECAKLVNDNDFAGSKMGDRLLFEHFGITE